MLSRIIHQDRLHLLLQPPLQNIIVGEHRSDLLHQTVIDMDCTCTHLYFCWFLTAKINKNTDTATFFMVGFLPFSSRGSIAFHPCRQKTNSEQSPSGEKPIKSAYTKCGCRNATALQRIGCRAVVPRQPHIIHSRIANADTHGFRIANAEEQGNSEEQG